LLGGSLIKVDMESQAENRMEFALSTRWNASRHTSGAKLIEEILQLGFTQVELGYDLRVHLVPGVLEMVRSNSIRVVSLHNYCPLPTSAPQAHPEVYLFTDEDSRMREFAVQHTSRTLRFAAEVGAKVVVAHAGHVSGTRLSRDLMALCNGGQRHSAEYERLLQKVRLVRDQKAGKYLVYLKECLERLAPVLDETGVKLALELLPTWESVPTEFEMEKLVAQHGERRIGCWYDIGHAQIRENLGFVNTARWRERLEPWIAGVHIHDVKAPAQDHLMPPDGDINFGELKKIAQRPIPLVLEPAPATPADRVAAGVEYLKKAWMAEPQPRQDNGEKRK
jgi:sugar phosphate isomerase/epimerase